jgi:hypothetical protein
MFLPERHLVVQFNIQSGATSIGKDIGTILKIHANPLLIYID